MSVNQCVQICKIYHVTLDWKLFSYATLTSNLLNYCDTGRKVLKFYLRLFNPPHFNPLCPTFHTANRIKNKKQIFTGRKIFRKSDLSLLFILFPIWRLRITFRYEWEPCLFMRNGGSRFSFYDIAQKLLIYLTYWTLFVNRFYRQFGAEEKEVVEDVSAGRTRRGQDALEKCWRRLLPLSFSSSLSFSPSLLLIMRVWSVAPVPDKEPRTICISAVRFVSR